MAPLDQNYYHELIVYLLINEPSDDFQIMQIIDKNESLEIKTTLADTPHPWIRYFAKYIDLGLFTLVVTIILVFSMLLGLELKIINPKLLQYLMKHQSNIVYGMVIIFLWVFGDAFCLWMFGTTPGKAILNIQIEKNDGAPITFSDALRRSFNIYGAGLGAGIPLIAFFAQYFSYTNLIKNGKTDWDNRLGFTIKHKKPGFLRGLI